MTEKEKIETWIKECVAERDVETGMRVIALFRMYFSIVPSNAEAAVKLTVAHLSITKEP